MELLFSRYPTLSVCESAIQQALEIMRSCYESGGKILACGNGGSAADGGHIVGELMKGFLLKRDVNDERIPEGLRERLQGSLPAISLSANEALMTAYANDVSPEMVFAQQVYGYGRKEDVLICLSTSGNSVNVVNAAKVAKAVGMRTISLTGAQGGELEKASTVTICVPATETFAVQEYHLPVYHYLCMALEEHFFGASKTDNTGRKCSYASA